MANSAGVDTGAQDAHGRGEGTDGGTGTGAGTGAGAAEERPGGTDRSRGRRARHAVVVGGSLSALLTARVLSDHADRVTVIERDRFPDGPEPRAGVPQSRHLHVLLASGQRAMEELLPGILDELREHGSPRVGQPDDLVQWQSGSFYRRTPASTHLLTGSRPMLEWLVRRRVLADPRITVVEGTEVVGLVGDATRVRGVRLRERGAGTRHDVRPLAADLVVDASGRGTRAPDWLAGIGAEPPHEETLDTGLAYASRLYRAPETAEGPECHGYFFVGDKDHAEGGVVLPVEGGLHIVTLTGLRGGEPPSDDEAFAEFATRLPHPALHEWLLKAEPVSPVHAFRSTANVRRRYDRPGRRPAGFLATGDALCAFNPVYGQGMTIAALGALALGNALSDPRRTPTTRRVQRALLKASRQAWDLSAGADRPLPGARGNAARIRAADRPGAWYLGRVLARAAGDPVVGDAFRQVTHLTSTVGVLFTPRVLRAVLFTPVGPELAQPQPQREPGSARPVRG
ncbi:FAD-dependent oxidoreductase [Streptomyces sp. NPDC059255]|uniref:FAD-dependent oxidoreductase n=1 Tax=Streptomyces sp. NPDC059255 TaxID=3346793 RepID=UPI0036900390